MLSNTSDELMHLSDTHQAARKAGRLVTRKIWLPKVIYDALPYFYLTSGFAAFFTTLYIDDWFWLLPHYFLFSAACLHLGVIVYRRRHASSQPSAESNG